MSITCRKVWRDLTRNKVRTVLAVLSIAVGVFAFGLVFGMYSVVRTRMVDDYRESRPAPVLIWGTLLDPATEDAVLREPGVIDAEGSVEALFRWRLEVETDWRDGDLFARTDYEAQRVGLIDLLEGDWPTRRALAVERLSAQHFGIPVGSTIVVEYGQHEVRLPVTGLVRDPDAVPPRFGGNALFYAMPETVFWLTGRDRGRTRVLVTSYSEDEAAKISERIYERLKSLQLPVTGWGYRNPGEHWAQAIVDSVFIILAVLGGLSLGMSAFLIVNTMSAIVVRQVWQVGVMKVVGATGGRVMRVYLATALVYGGLALVLAVPLSTICTHFLAGWILDQLNIAIGPLRVVLVVVGLQVVVGLAVSLLAALVPVLGGVRISAHRAISTYGLGGKFGQGLLDRLIGRVRGLPRPTALSLRNTFRRKARVALTLVTLALGGMVFMMVMSVDESFDTTLEVLMQDMGYDVMIYFERRQLVERLIEVGESVPGVARTEVWMGHFGTMLKFREDDELGGHIGLWGVPPDSEMFNPRIVNGRELLPGDDHAILLNNKIAAEEGIQVGDEVRFSLGEEKTWTVVGIVLNLNYNQRECFVPYDTAARELRYGKRGREIMVQSDRHDAESQQALLRTLREVYTAHDMEVSSSHAASEVRATIRSAFDIIVYLLLTMAFLAAVVGSIGLMDTMAINVVERGREIGVMRAIGATSSNVAGIVVVEGVLIGVLSWLLALPLSYPSAVVLGQVVGEALLSTRLQFTYSVAGTFIWLVIVVVLSALASLWPALRATRVSVREALAYE